MNTPNPYQKPSRATRIVTALVTLLLFAGLTTGIYFVIDYGMRQRLATECTATTDNLRTVQARTRQLIQNQADTLGLSQDQVQDKQTVKDMDAARKSAKDLTNYSPANCQPSQNAKILRANKQEITDKYAKLNQTYRELDQAIRAAAASYQAKELADAKDALTSTLNSAKEVATKLQNSGNASMAMRFESVLHQVQQLANDDNVSEIKQAREQLDEVIDQVNNSLSTTAKEVNEIESKIKAITNQRGSDGTYKDTATNIIHTAGLKESWGLMSMQGACAISSEQAQSWVGAFCTATPDRVYISDSRPAEEYADSYFADAMRHEVGHYLIYRRCGTTSPRVIDGSGADTEAVTSAYAVLYLGANDNTLNRAADSRYHMTTSAYAAAAKIHSGQCR